MGKDYTFLRFPEFKRKAVTLSYDDGVRTDIKLIKILDEYGLKCTFNLNSGLFAKNEGELRLTEKEAAELYANSGHEVAVHGFKHLSLTAVTEEAAARDVIKDRENLERIFGKIIKGMAYANGSFSENSVETLRKCGIEYARTCVSTHAFDLPKEWITLPATCHHNDPDLFRLADEFINREDSDYAWINSPMMFYLWGHSYEFRDNENWSVIEEFAKKVGKRKDIWYATNGEIYEYVQAFDRLKWSVDYKFVYNPTDKDIYVDMLGDKLVLKAGKTTVTKGF